MSEFPTTSYLFEKYISQIQEHLSNLPEYCAFFDDSVKTKNYGHVKEYASKSFEIVTAIWAFFRLLQPVEEDNAFTCDGITYDNIFFLDKFSNIKNDELKYFLILFLKGKMFTSSYDHQQYQFFPVRDGQFLGIPMATFIEIHKRSWFNFVDLSPCKERTKLLWKQADLIDNLFWQYGFLRRPEIETNTAEEVADKLVGFFEKHLGNIK